MSPLNFTHPCLHRLKSIEKGVEDNGCLCSGDAQAIRDGRHAHAVDDPETDRLRLVALLAVHRRGVLVEDHAGHVLVHVAGIAEQAEQGCVTGQMGEQSHFDLRVIRAYQYTPVASTIRIKCKKELKKIKSGIKIRQNNQKDIPCGCNKEFSAVEFKTIEFLGVWGRLQVGSTAAETTGAHYCLIPNAMYLRCCRRSLVRLTRVGTTAVSRLVSHDDFVWREAVRSIAVARLVRSQKQRLGGERYDERTQTLDIGREELRQAAK